METKLNIGDALSYGVDRITTRGGAILLAAYVLIQLIGQVGFQSLFVRALSESATDNQVLQAFPFALDLPIGISGGLLVLLMLVGFILSIVSMRAIYMDIDSVPTADHTRRLARTVGILFIVGIIINIAVSLGSILILPGIYLAVSLIFATVVVVIEDAGVIESLERSWELTSGNRLTLFGLGLIMSVLFFVGYVITVISSVLSPIVGSLLLSIMFGSVALFQIAVLIGAYRQLAGDSEQPASASW